MSKRNIKKFEKYIMDHELMKDVFDETSIIDDKQKTNIHDYDKLNLDYLLMKDVVDDNDNWDNYTENKNEVISFLESDNFEKDAESFYKSFNSSKRISFFTPYSVDDLKEFDLFKLEGYNIGFAVKKDGDIILVHNNEPSINGIGFLLLNKAID